MHTITRHEIDWKTIEDNFDTPLSDINDELKDDYERLIDLKRTSPMFFTMEIRDKLSIPTDFEPNTLAASIFGCELEYSNGDYVCNPMCIKDGCRKSVWMMNSDGSNMKCIHEVDSDTAHIYAPSSVVYPWKCISKHPSMMASLRDRGVERIEVYRMAYSSSRYSGTFHLDDLENQPEKDNSDNDFHTNEDKDAGIYNSNFRSLTLFIVFIIIFVISLAVICYFIIHNIPELYTWIN